MEKTTNRNDYDAIIVGSGTCGATIARELVKQNKKVLILELGANNPLRESFFGAASIADAVSVSDKLATMRAITTGGSTGLYFAVAEPPNLEAFNELGIDLSSAYAETKLELPIAPLADHLMGEQTTKLRDSAVSLGYSWEKKRMLIDQGKCQSGYNYEARWKARQFVEDALENGAQIINKAKVSRVLIENNKAIGVEYIVQHPLRKNEVKQVFSGNIVLAAGSLSSPVILKNSGLEYIGEDGFYCCPNFAVLGFVPGLNGTNNFVGSMGAELNEKIVIGDANLSHKFFQMVMLAELKFSRLFSYSTSMAVGGSVKDGIGGTLRSDGRYYKQLGQEVINNLKKGEDAGIEILKNAGAKKILKFDHASANVGGVIRIKEHLDENLQTEVSNLYVCDGSVLPENSSLSPTLTLVCLSKYLSKHLLSTI